MLAEKSGDVKSVGAAALRRGEGVRVQRVEVPTLVTVRCAAAACKVTVMERKETHG